MTFSPEQSALLAQPLDPKHVKPPKKFGPKGDYIEGWHAIAEANRIFGFDGWSYTLDLTRDDVSLGKDRDGNDQWQAAYTCLCTVEAGGVKRQDVGFGSGFAKIVGDAIEGATKEAATDALKRALRTFGHAFGLALYDKTREHVQAPPKEPDPDKPDPDSIIADKTREWLQTQIETSPFTVLDVCQHFSVLSLAALKFHQVAEVGKFIKQKKAA